MFLTFGSAVTKNAFRNGALQLVIHTLDPITEGNFISVKENYLCSTYKTKFYCNQVAF